MLPQVKGLPGVQNQGHSETVSGYLLKRLY